LALLLAKSAESAGVIAVRAADFTIDIQALRTRTDYWYCSKPSLNEAF
jgi:hypothetical protein